MEFVPSRSQGHLIVASIRVLTHQKQRPPTPEEIAEQIGYGREVLLHVVRGLEARGIVRSIENPFDVRIDISDHHAIEELPEEAKGPDMGQEIEDFHKKAEDRQKKIEQMMRENDPESRTREKTKEVEKEFERFRSQKGRSPFSK